MGQQVQYLIILTKIKYTKFIYIIIHEIVPLSENRDCSVKQCRADTVIQSDVWTWANVVLSSGQLPSLPKPFWQKALQPESLPWAILEACPGWYERYVFSFLHSEDHLMLALMKHAGFYWYVCHSDSKYYVLTSSSMLKWKVWSLYVVAPSPPLLSTHGQFTFFSPRGFRLSEMMSLSPGAYIHGTRLWQTEIQIPRPKKTLTD